MKRIVILLVLLGFSIAHAQVDAPPAYPREGASRMLENEHVIVWNITWLKQDYPIHRHRFDHTGVYYQPGDRLITSVEGEEREVHTDAWNISFQLAGVTHTESGISDQPLRAVFIQIKRPVSDYQVINNSLPRFPDDSPLDRRSNERVRVWEYNESVAADTTGHFHAHDAVVVWFDEQNEPNVHFVSRGTVHGNDIPSGAVRVFVFELL